jgi:hypothetical protein
MMMKLSEVGRLGWMMDENGGLILSKLCLSLGNVDCRGVVMPIF